MNADLTAQSYQLARQRYADLGVDSDRAIQRLGQISISSTAGRVTTSPLREFEATSAEGWPSPATIPARPVRRTSLRRDLELALSLIPGRHRLTLHAFYAETSGKKVDRDAIEPSHFQNWVDCAPTSASDSISTPPSSPTRNPRTASPSPIATRTSAGSGSSTALLPRDRSPLFGKALGTPCVTNV